MCQSWYSFKNLNEEFNGAFDMRLLSTVDNVCPNANYSILEKILIECYKKSFETKTIRFNRLVHADFLFTVHNFDGVRDTTSADESMIGTNIEH